MKVNRKNVALGLVVGALAAGAVAVGAGSALAAAGGSNTAAAPTTPPVSGSGPRHFGAMPGMGFAVNPPIDVAATYLGLSQSALQTQLQSGKSLAQVAQAQSKSVSGLEDAMLAAITKNLDANSALSADQRAAMLAQVKGHLDTMVNTPHPSGAGFGPMGAGFGLMGPGMRGIGQ